MRQTNLLLKLMNKLLFCWLISGLSLINEFELWLILINQIKFSNSSREINNQQYYYNSKYIVKNPEYINWGEVPLLESRCVTICINPVLLYYLLSLNDLWN